MPTAQIVGLLGGISTGILAIGGAAVVLTLSLAGLCTMFSWLDMHIGGFVKKVFTSVMVGGAMMGGAGAFGIWFSQQLGLAVAPAAPTTTAAVVNLLLGSGIASLFS